MKNDFQVLKIGNPLLSHVEDYKETLTALKSQIKKLQKDEAVVMVGHGTHHPATSAYAMMDYISRDTPENIYIGTIEGFPTYNNVVSKLKKNNIKKITLMPFMFVAGDHANNDINGNEKSSWRRMLKKEGFEVKVYLHGLGENEKIQELFLKHIEQTINKKEENMKRKKAAYALDS